MPTPTKKPSTTKSIEAIYDSLSRHYGTVLWEPRYNGISELIFTVLTQHTSDRNAEKAFQQLVDYFGIASSDDWIKVLNADVEKIKSLIRSGGLSNIKAKRIKDILSQLFQTYDSFDLSFLAELPLPEAKKKLNELPGVGPKTTAVVLSFAFGMPAFPVDTHIYRVTKRLGLIPEQISADEAHDELEKIIEPDLVFPMHVYLITHGRQICKARKPLCNACPIESQCPSSTNVPRTQSSDLASVVQW